jgi:hypothetical protein
LAPQNCCSPTNGPDRHMLSCGVRIATYSRCPTTKPHQR